MEDFSARHGDYQRVPAVNTDSMWQLEPVGASQGDQWHRDPVYHLQPSLINPSSTPENLSQMVAWPKFGVYTPFYGYFDPTRRSGQSIAHACGALVGRCPIGGAYCKTSAGAAVSTGCRGGPTCRAGWKARGGLLGIGIGISTIDWIGWLETSWSMGASGRRCSKSRGWPPKPKASGVSGIQLVLRSTSSVLGELEGKAPGFSETSESSLRGVGLSKSQAVGVGSWHHLKWGCSWQMTGVEFLH